MLLFKIFDPVIATDVSDNLANFSFSGILLHWPKSVKKMKGPGRYHPLRAKLRDRPWAAWCLAFGGLARAESSGMVEQGGLPVGDFTHLRSHQSSP